MMDGSQIQREEPASWESFRSMPTGDLIDRFEVGVDRLDARVFEIGDDGLDRAWPAEAGVGPWPIRVLLGHLADAEVSFAHRMRRVVAEPGSEIAVWDEHAFIDAGLYGVVAMSGGAKPVSPAIGGDVAAVHTMRRWLGPWLRSLPADAWQRSGLHAGRGPLSLTDLLAYDTWHLERHAWFCNLKVAKLLGE